MDYAFMFLLGFILGAIAVMIYGWYQIKKMKKVKKTLLDQIKAKAVEEDKKKDSIKERLLKASELAQTQMTIRSQIEMPSNGALHSKYKNDLVHELHDLEQKKLNILQTIIAEGIDPMITIINDTGGKTEMPLSTYINDAITSLDKSAGNQPVPESINPKKSNRFIVHKGGKDDGTTH